MFRGLSWADDLLFTGGSKWASEGTNPFYRGEIEPGLAFNVEETDLA